MSGKLAVSQQSVQCAPGKKSEEAEKLEGKIGLIASVQFTEASAGMVSVVGWLLRSHA